MSDGGGEMLEISSTAAFERCFRKKAVLLFCADWHEATPVLKTVVGAIAKNQNQQQEQEHPILFASVDAEAASELSDKFNVTMVPTLVLVNGGTCSSPAVLEALEGVTEPSQVTVAVQRLIRVTEAEGGRPASSVSADAGAAAASADATAATQDPQKALDERLDRLIHGDTVMLFMKGTPAAPRCGFSRQAVELLNDHRVPFGSFDILSDEDVRQGLKTYSDWPTYPQIVSAFASDWWCLRLMFCVEIVLTYPCFVVNVPSTSRANSLVD